MEAVSLDTARLKAVLAMFSISQGELARASGVSTAMICLLLAGRKKVSRRIAVSLVHGLERLLTGRRLDTAYFVRSPDAARAAPSD